MNPTTNTEAGAVADVAAIASGLTKAQRRELLHAPSTCVQGFAPVGRLHAEGLVTITFAMNSRWRYAPTDLGLAVRQHLEQGATAGVVGGKECG